MTTANDETGSTISATIPEARKRMKIFRAADASALDHDRMPMEGFDPGVMAGMGKLMAAGVTAGAGEKTMVLFGEAGDDGMSLVYAWFKSGYILPKHSHNSDCLYYVLAGDLKMGTQTLAKGDGVFIPANHAYTYEVGPHGVEVLEFRNATRFNFVFKGNDEGHWDKVAGAYRNNASSWEHEVEPSHQ
jgi:quercetin dioxygenase-like cupin family protein